MLNETFLCLAFFAFFAVLGLFQLFHEIAFAVAMHPGLIAVYAQFCCYVLAVQLVTGKNKVSLECGTNQCGNEYICNNTVQHMPAKV